MANTGGTFVERAQKLVLLILLLSCCGSNFVSGHSDDQQESDSSVVILFLFIGLGLGILVMQTMSYFDELVPYTVVLFLLGVIFSTVNNKDAGIFGESIAQLENIDAELVLFIFLPPLIFGDAMSLNWYLVKGGIVQATILAGPAVVFGALAYGMVAKYFLPYNWNWNLSMLFGVILSSTDPVAVVAVLKSACAAPKMTLLIVGESLLNDASSMVLFTVFFNALNGRTYSIVELIEYSFAGVIGSLLLGFLFGAVAVLWLRSASRPLNDTDVTIQIAITIACAYVCFFTAQYILELSGVLACCAAGIMLAWLGPPVILNQETMHSVWGMIEWSMNTLIFLLTGLLIGRRIFDEVHAIDWLYCFALYVILIALRFVIIGILYPWLSNIGHKFSRNEAIFMSWAGLRGALGMTLALIVAKSGPKDLQRETSRMFFYVGGIAALTLLINGTTVKPLLRYLALIDNDAEERAFLVSQIKKQLRGKMDKVISEVAQEFRFTENDMKEVRLYCTLLHEEGDAVDRIMRDSAQVSGGVYSTLHNGIDTGHEPMKITTPIDNKDDYCLSFNGISDHSDHEQDVQPIPAMPVVMQRNASDLLNEAVDRLKQRSDISIDTTTYKHMPASPTTPVAMSSSRASRLKLAAMKGVGASSSALNAVDATHNHAMLVYLRTVFMETVRAKYRRHIARGRLPRLCHSAQFLLYSIEVGIDEIGTSSRGTLDWNCVEKELKNPPKRLICVLNFFEDHLPNFFAKHISLLVGQLEALQEKRTVYMLTSFIDAHEYAQSKILDDEEGGGRDQRENLQETPELRKVVSESRLAVRQARKMLDAMSCDTVRAIRSKQAANLVLSRQAEMLKHMVEEGLVSTVHAEDILHEISKDTARIEESRNVLYRTQADERGRQRQAQKTEERESYNSSRRTSTANSPYSSPTKQLHPQHNNVQNSPAGSAPYHSPIRKSGRWANNDLFSQVEMNGKHGFVKLTDEELA